MSGRVVEKEDDLVVIDPRRFKLPRWFTHLRREQLRIAELAKDYFDSGIDVVIIEAPVGTGKAQPLTEPVLTSEGFLPMGEVKVGTTVYDKEGKPTKVIAVHPQGKKDVFRVSFQDGSSTLCCGEHLWLVHRADDADRKWKEDTTFNLINRHRKDRREFHIPITKPVEFSEKELPIDPYLLGLLLGDGSFRHGSITFTTDDIELVESIDSILQSNFPTVSIFSDKSKYGYRLSSIHGIFGGRSPLIEALVGLGLWSPRCKMNGGHGKSGKSGLFGASSHTKFIPNQYLMGSPAQRLSLLQGLMDTDGHAMKKGGAEFLSVSKDLALGVKFLVQSLGGIVKWVEKKVKGYDSIYYRLNIKLMDCPFRMKRKISTWIKPTKYPPARLIESIEYVEQMECQCITVDSDNHTYLTNEFIVTHNSVMVELIRQLLKSRMVYVAPHIVLQEQFSTAFPYAKIIKGRAKYPHGGYNGKSKFPRETCADCLRKSLCGESGCEYREANQIFQGAAVGVTNFSYYLTGANYLHMFKPGTMTEEQGKDCGGRPGKWIDDYLTVFDEADTMEKLLLDHLEVYVSIKSLEYIGREAGISLKVPTPPVSDFDQWPGWWMDVRDFVSAALKKHGKPNPKDIRAIRWVAKVAKLKLALEQVEVDWIYDPIRAKGQKGFRTGPALAVSLKPIQVGEIAKSKLWDHCGKTVATSGSIINADIWAEETGLDKSGKSYEFIQVDSPWDRWRRPIFRVPGLNVSKADHKQKWRNQPSELWDKLIGDIVWVLCKYPNERTLIHSVSHEMAEDIGFELKKIFGNRIIVHEGPKNFQKKSYWDRENEEETDVIDVADVKKDTALKRFLDPANPDGVLVSASAGRGVDFSDDKCRNIIIPKVPWGNVKDRRISAIMNTYTGKMRYYVNTCREMLQYCGRGMRHEDDWCRIFVLDDTFDRIVDCTGLLPNYFQKSIRPKEDYMSRF